MLFYNKKTLCVLMLTMLCGACTHAKKALPLPENTYRILADFESMRRDYEPLVRQLGKSISEKQLLASLEKLDALSKKYGLLQKGTLTIPPHSKVELSYRSYCLDLYKQEPTNQSAFTAKPIADSGIPLLKNLILFSEHSAKDHKQIQEIIWNIANATPLEKYPARSNI